jgi:hypothetical protein
MQEVTRAPWFTSVRAPPFQSQGWPKGADVEFFSVGGGNRHWALDTSPMVPIAPAPLQTIYSFTTKSGATSTDTD